MSEDGHSEGEAILSLFLLLSSDFLSYPYTNFYFVQVEILIVEMKTLEEEILVAETSDMEAEIHLFDTGMTLTDSE